MKSFDIEDTYLGSIRTNPGSAGFELERWLDELHRHPNVIAGKPIKGINPFTRQPIHSCGARVITGRQQVGMLTWTQSQAEVEVAVFGAPETMLPIARALAASLGGRFEEHQAADGESEEA